MKKQGEILPLGQRSIASTFLFRSPNQSIGFEKKVETRASNQKGSSISLSDFLSKKLHKSPVLPGVVPGNKKFLGPSSKDTSKRVNGQINHSKDGETGIPCALDAIFEQYKNTMKGNQDVSAPNDSSEVSVSITDDVRTSRKRGLIEGSGGTQSARKVLAVLGEGSAEKKPTRKVRMRDNIEKHSTLFNHYANGGGWWDCNMEGVDNEEVGCNEVWEGLGSTTLGGLDWH